MTVAQAATLLKVTQKRVRQMLREGKLSAVAGTSPLELPTSDVLALREQRQAAEKRGGPRRPGPQGAAQSQTVTLDDVLRLLSSEGARAIEATESAFQQALAARDQVEQILRDDLDRTRAENERLRQELAQASRRRGLFRR
jgi:excisionase family DNA binding protein